jgi:hypothetical protein
MYQLVEAQADYHRRSLAALEGILPTIQAQNGKGNLNESKPVNNFLYKIQNMNVFSLQE